MEIPDDLIALQRAADDEGRRLSELTDNDEREAQRLVWYEAGARAQAAVTEWAQANGKNRFDVEKQVRATVRQPPPSDS
ncbi:hypothetical protein ACFWMQ_15645 [Streptomyces sp. NPDC058372]|uniref:hypothetical protein n=1 Tax=Streptomyces sp. NPDC058372 TaxID=3346464 RepID=UPI0036470F77